MQASAHFLKLVNHPLKSRIFLLSKLPSAFFCGVRIQQAKDDTAVVTVPYTWFTTNPFRSTYFACLAMAAEMSTGILAMAHVYQKKPAISMLVVGLQSEYYKKAIGLTTFTCMDGNLFGEAIELATTSGVPQAVTATSTGVNAANEKVATFKVTWSFRVRS
jgi:hypothetical protein